MLVLISADHHRAFPPFQAATARSTPPPASSTQSPRCILTTTARISSLPGRSLLIRSLENHQDPHRRAVSNHRVPRAPPRPAPYRPRPPPHLSRSPRAPLAQQRHQPIHIEAKRRSPPPIPNSLSQRAPPPAAPCCSAATTTDPARLPLQVYRSDMTWRWHVCNIY